MQSNLAHKKILLGITGGIAAYKIPLLVRELRKAGADVKVVVTQAALEFVTITTLEALSLNPVHTELTDGMQHIDLARFADLIVIAPMTANFMAKLCHGYADDLLSTLCLAADVPIALAPAMNQQMWQSDVTQQNVKMMQSLPQFFLWGPANGAQACGEVGPGRMVEVAELLFNIEQYFAKKTLMGKKVIITAGPTQEAIDPMRFITNHSSGKMGYALAEVAANLGAEVLLISGPTALPAPPHVKRIAVKTANDMHQAVMDHVMGSDILIGAAAVCDYRSVVVAEHKIKKQQAELTITLTPNPDILLSVAELPHKPLLIGFAAETEHLIENATKKRHAKQLDMIVANHIGEGMGFAEDVNQVTLITRDDKTIALPLMSKHKVALAIIEQIQFLTACDQQ